MSKYHDEFDHRQDAMRYLLARQPVGGKFLSLSTPKRFPWWGYRRFFPWPKLETLRDRIARLWDW